MNLVKTIALFAVVRRRMTFLLCLLYGIPAVFAATITVTTLDDSGPGSLRQAIADAAPGDTIDFGVSGTIWLTNGQLVLDKDLIISGPGAANLRVSGNNQSRVFLVTNCMVTLSGLAISDGQELSSSPYGGGAILNWGNVTIRDSSISTNHILRVDNIPGVGGGILNLGTMMASNCILSANTCLTAFGSGGGAYNAGSLTIIDSTVSENQSVYASALANIGTLQIIGSLVTHNEGNIASGILNSGLLLATNTIVTGNRHLAAGGTGGGIGNIGTAWLQACTISSNAAGAGGGIYNSASGSVQVRDSSILGNTADAGGGILNEGTLLMSNTAVSGNSANGGASVGGGILNQGTMALMSSTISSNTAQFDGGISIQSGQADLLHCTISGNQAPGNGYGGGISCHSSATLSLSNCTVAYNSAANGSGGLYVASAGARGANNIIAANTPSDFFGAFNSLDYNLIQNTSGAAITGTTTHNIYGKDPLLGPLADNGGPTMTHALLPGSPAIDHGSSGGLATDQRGQPRAFNFPAYFDADDGSDIGAYELQERAQSGPALTVNTIDDLNDGTASLAHCSLREAIKAANLYPGTATILFETNAPGIHTGVTGIIVLTGGEMLITNHVNVIGPGAVILAVSGNNSSRVFNIVSNQTVSLAGLTIADGRTNNSGGGGVLSSGRLTVSACVISNCSGSVGAGLRNLYGTLTVDGCTLVSNRSVSAVGGSGGGIGNDGTLVVVNSGFYGNRASLGGGVFNWSGTASLTASTLAANEASNGGGIRNEGTSFAVSNCTISGNTATFGGGAYNLTGTLALESCTFSGNSSTNSGGGIYNDRGLGFPFNIPGGRVSLRNSIVGGNSAGTSGPDIRMDGTTAVNSGDFNLIQDTNGCTITNLTAHNIYGLDPKLGPLAYLGGSTPTHALRFDSPALDAGHSGGLANDQRGLPRSIDDTNTANAGDATDIGAYEADPNLRITAIEKVGADIRLRFNTVFGRTYRVDSEDNLDLSWTPLFNNIPGDGSSVQLQNTGAANLPRRFYRAVVLP